MPRSATPASVSQTYMGASIVSSSEKDMRHIKASVDNGVPSIMVKRQVPKTGSLNPLTADFGIIVTAAPVSTLASMVHFCPVDGFSRLMHTYTCSDGSVNFNRSMTSVFVTTSYNLRLRHAGRAVAH